MVVKKPKARYVSYENITEEEKKALKTAVDVSMPGIEEMPGGNVFVTVHSYNQQQHEDEYLLRSFCWANELFIVRDSVQAATRIYKKIRVRKCTS